MDVLPLAAMDHILRSCGEKRISKGAAEALRIELEYIAKELADEAVLLANHGRRRTIMSKDIDFALR